MPAEVTTDSAALSPYLIGGGLSMGRAPGLMDYTSAYQNALNINQQNYNNIMKGYQGLTSSVLGNIRGIGEAQAQAIEDVYAQQSGGAAQSLISRGLGNTTVANSVQRGLVLDREKAKTGLANQLAQLYAGYQSQLGLSQLGFMNSVSAPYPNPAAYADLLRQRGMVQQGKKTGQGGQLFPIGGGGGRSGPSTLDRWTGPDLTRGGYSPVNQPSAPSLQYPFNMGGNYGGGGASDIYSQLDYPSSFNDIFGFGRDVNPNAYAPQQSPQSIAGMIGMGAGGMSPLSMLGGALNPNAGGYDMGGFYDPMNDPSLSQYYNDTPDYSGYQSSGGDFGGGASDWYDPMYDADLAGYYE